MSSGGSTASRSGVPAPIGPLTINLDWTRADPVALNNELNSSAFGPFIVGTATRPYILASGATGPVMVAVGTGVPAAIQAYQALLSSANGNTLPGYDPLVAAGKVNALGQPCTGGASAVVRARTSPTCQLR